MPLTVTIQREALLNMGRQPGGPIHLHWLKIMADIDRRAKLKLSNQMVHVRTGNLRSSQQAPTVQVLGDQIVGQAVNIAKYAAYVHDGTRPHDIVAKHDIASGPRAGQPGYLKFTPSTGGEPIFRHSVHHPGTKGRPWLRQSLIEALAAHA